MRTFHLPLPDHVHEALRTEANAARRPATEIVRQALDHWLAARRRERLDAEIEAYAMEMAGTALDLDPELEAAGIDCLLASDSSP